MRSIWTCVDACVLADFFGSECGCCNRATDADCRIGVFTFGQNFIYLHGIVIIHRQSGWTISFVLYSRVALGPDTESRTTDNDR